MPKVRTDYGKFSSDRKHVEKAQEGYFEGMAGEVVQVHLSTGKEIEGVLSASTYNRYDVVLENEEGRYLVPKAAIEYVRAIPDKRR